MPYRLDIPGQVSEFQLRAIEAVATLVPENGCVVEVGSLFGLSSWAWAQSIPPSASIYCIDPWEDNKGVRGLEQTHGIKYGLEQFKTYTRDCHNLTAIQAYSPIGMQDWRRPVDLYYEDSVHTNPILDQNIEFWTSHLKPTGIVCGDDYRPRFPDVQAAAKRQAAAHGRKLWIVDFFWCVLPDFADVPAAAAVAEVLADLADEVSRAQIDRPDIHIGPVIPLPDMFAAATPGPFPMRIVNDGNGIWPVTAKAELQLVTEIIDGNEAILATRSYGLGVEQLAFDRPVDRDVILPFGVDLPEEALLRVSVAGHPNPDSPSTLKYERRIRIASPPVARRYHIGDIVSFAAGSDISAWQGRGWSRAEARHSWTEGAESELSLDLDGPELGGGWLNIRLRPFVAADALKAQRLSIEANGVEIFVGKLSSPTSLSIPLPAMDGRHLRLRMTHPDARRPSDVIPGSKDRRVLAFAFEEFALSRRPAPL